MQRRQLIIPFCICIITIFLISKMVTAHAEDSTDETGYPTPTDVIDVFETPLPTMTEYAYDESDPPTDPTETPTPTATTQPIDIEPTATTVVVESKPATTDFVDVEKPVTEMPLSVTNDASTQDAGSTLDNTPTPLAPLSIRSNPGSTVRSCAPHTTEVFEGVTTPNTMLEVRFDLRIVGGGMSTPSGRYLLSVYMGDEASGSHTISIVKRYTGRLLQKELCEIP
jgi:hypothetical protein